MRSKEKGIFLVARCSSLGAPLPSNGDYLSWCALVLEWGFPGSGASQARTRTHRWLVACLLVRPCPGVGGNWIESLVLNHQTSEKYFLHLGNACSSLLVSRYFLLEKGFWVACYQGILAQLEGMIRWIINN